MASKLLAAAERKFVNITDLEDLRNVKNGNRPLGAQIIGILHGKCVSVDISAAKKRKTAVGCRSAVDGFRPRVRHQELQAIRKRLLHANLESMVDRICDRRRI